MRRSPVLARLTAVVVDTPEAEHRQSLDESRRTLAWRLAQLVKAGYDDEAAVDLALADVDLHAATELLARGCPADTALRILL